MKALFFVSQKCLFEMCNSMFLSRTMKHFVFISFMDELKPIILSLKISGRNDNITLFFADRVLSGGAS